MVNNIITTNYLNMTEIEQHKYDIEYEQCQYDIACKHPTETDQYYRALSMQGQKLQDKKEKLKNLLNTSHMENNKTKLIFLDTETTGLAETDRLLQLAYKYQDEGGAIISCNDLFNPGLPIGIEAMSVHHFTEKMVKDKTKFKDSTSYEILRDLFDNDYIVVAHNAPFDIGMLEREGLKVNKFICTKKVAVFDDEKAELTNHRLQYLRYYFGIETDAVAHSAEGDVDVLEKVFDEYFKKYTIDQMLDISSKPSLIRRINFGKYVNELLVDILKKDRGYLEWLLNAKKVNQVKEQKDLDMIYTIETLLKV